MERIVKSCRTPEHDCQSERSPRSLSIPPLTRSSPRRRGAAPCGWTSRFSPAKAVKSICKAEKEGQIPEGRTGHNVQEDDRVLREEYVISQEHTRALWSLGSKALFSVFRKVFRPPPLSSSTSLLPHFFCKTVTISRLRPSSGAPPFRDRISSFRACSPVHRAHIRSINASATRTIGTDAGTFLPQRRLETGQLRRGLRTHIPDKAAVEHLVILLAASRQALRRIRISSRILTISVIRVYLLAAAGDPSG